MATPDQIRIAADRARPRLMELWWALRPLTSVVRFMQTGAHPDDETTDMLAALALRDGINISYACATRGEGGQNDIGTEAGADLGALRTREMEQACAVPGMRLYWLATGPADSIADFGFSRSGEATLARWGRDRTILRLAGIVRTERPDILCPTFLDVPGQHGHHRAMTRATHAVMEAAADPGLATSLPPWRVKKLYLPAWSGAGPSYDDDRPPPPATVAIAGTDREPMTGWSWQRIGQQSRAFHRTQGMGRWIPAGAGHDWPLHLAETHVDGPDTFIWSGLARTVGDLAAMPGAEPVASHLRAADSGIRAAVAAFPDFPAVARAAGQAVTALRAARDLCPVDLVDDLRPRLDAKLNQLGHVMRLALGVEARAIPGATYIDVGTSVPLVTELDPGEAESARLAWDLPAGWTVGAERSGSGRGETGRLSIAADASPHNPCPTGYDPLAPPVPRMIVHIGDRGVSVAVPLPFETGPVVLPAPRAAAVPAAVLLNRAIGRRRFDVVFSDLVPKTARPVLALPAGWTGTWTKSGLAVSAPEDAAPGHYTPGVRLAGAPAATARPIRHDHTRPTARIAPARVRVGIFDIAIPDARVGYIGANRDRAGHWLAATGIDVTPLTDSDLQRESRFPDFDTLVTGVFAIRLRPALGEAMPAIHRWIEAGGTLVTLYHRPWDNWDPDTIPPRRLEIGQPSLRWRVTDETATVTQLAPHPVLETPNRITQADWSGWVRERGLYFASRWDKAYTPLLSMSDPGEPPLRGALLVADIGKGRHIHTALTLHHQMEHLVPGAFRLFANLVAVRCPD